MTKLLFLLLFLSMAIVLPAQAQSNKALDFKEKDKVLIEDYEMVGFTGLTVESWVNLDNYLSGPFTASGSPVLMQRTDPAIGPHNDYGIILMVLCLNHQDIHDKQLAFGLNFGEDGDVHVGLHSGDTIRLNEWHHLAGTWDGDYMRVYIDGVLANTFDVTDSQYDIFYSPDYGMYLGYRDEGQYGYLDGKIDDIRIWDYARTESQIRETMYQELAGNESGLYAYWNLNEGTGDYIYDLGSNNFDGYLGNTEGIADLRDPNWVTSTAPIPYYSILDGNYDSSWVWAAGQLAPQNDWAKVKIFDEVTLASDETLSDFTIANIGALTVDDTYTLTVSGDFLIESDQNSTGSLIDDGTISYSDATVQRFLSEDRWHYVSSPMEDATAGVFTSIYLRSWDEPSETWSYITNISTSLNEMQGYAAWASSSYTGDDTVEFTGSFNTGNYSMSLTNTAGTSGLPEDDPSGYNFIGNPYPSGIDWDDASWTKTNVDDAIYIITYISSNRQYASYVDGVSTHGATNEIAPHQGFFVKCNSTSGGSIQVTDDARIHTSQEFFKNTLSNDPLIKLRVNDHNGLYDETVIRAKDEATMEFDGAFDALKLKGSDGIPQIYTQFEDETIYSINTIDEFNNGTVIPVNFEAGEAGIYELSFKLKDGLQNLPILLEDKKENILFNPKVSGTYKFIANQNDDPSRFLLHFSFSEVQSEETQNTDALVFIKDEQLVVSLLDNNFGQVRIFDLSGRMLKQAEVAKGVNSIEINARPGYLLVEVLTSDKVTTKKVFLK